jgi:hypothetical protein
MFEKVAEALERRAFNGYVRAHRGSSLTEAEWLKVRNSKAGERDFSEEHPEYDWPRPPELFYAWWLDMCEIPGPYRGKWVRP